MRLLMILLLGLLVSAPVAGFAGQSLVNSEVNVDVVAKDPAEARAQAMANAEVNGLMELLERLGPPGQAKDLMNTLDAKKISAMVKGTQVVDEKITDNRYRARMIVSFDGADIEALISSLSAPDVKKTAPATIGSFLVVPALEVNNQKMLWEETNPWKAVWRSVALEVTSGDVVAPYGDTRDIATLSYDGMQEATYEKVSPLAIRYGTSDVVLLQARYSQRPDMTLSVLARRINRQNITANVFSYRGDPQETRDLLFARAARDIIATLQEKKVDETSLNKTVRGGDNNEVMMLASISTMSSWTKLRKKLISLPMVDRVEVLAMSARQADILVFYRGGEESFTNALASQSIRLKKNPTYWVVSND